MTYFVWSFRLDLRDESLCMITWTCLWISTNVTAVLNAGRAVHVELWPSSFVTYTRLQSFGCVTGNLFSAVLCACVCLYLAITSLHIKIETCWNSRHVRTCWGGKDLLITGNDWRYWVLGCQKTIFTVQLLVADGSFGGLVHTRGKGEYTCAQGIYYPCTYG